MVSFDRGKRRVFLLLAVAGFVFLLIDISMISGADVRSKIDKIPIPGKTPLPPSKSDSSPPVWHDDSSDLGNVDAVDSHPIRELMRLADQAFVAYDEDRSTTFRETVAKYRRKYGRHPPPGFRDWYKFARKKNVHNIDDFEQIMDDLRPFWGVAPAKLRALAAKMVETDEFGVSGIHIRDGKVAQLTQANWRAETFARMIEGFVESLPDMDIAMNKLDQPRLVVPWEELQTLLAAEEATRQMVPETEASWTKNMTGMYIENATIPDVDPEWFPAHGKQYMDIAAPTCPPESHARDNSSTQLAAESLYKDQKGGLITNFNRSTDLCTVGPEIQWKHGFLFTPSTILASRQLLPIFGECKVSVNNDILFPANMYWLEDDRYQYDGNFDYDWDDKKDVMIWRGVTSGGAQLADNWQQMHRQRLVMMVNGTEMQDQEVRILSENPENKGTYENFYQFHPSKFANDHTDVGFVETWGCIPNCSFYDNVWTLKPQSTLGEQFQYKYVVDVDGHSFSGRWRAFLQSKSMGIKSTIFREWHDSRLFAWRHFVPMDNRYDDIYTILTYFIGLGKPGFNRDAGDANYANGDAYVPRHDFEARKLGRQGKEWAAKVLRAEDIEIYTYRLLLEYARIIDDNRDHIGYSGDGSELDKYDADHPVTGNHA